MRFIGITGGVGAGKSRVLAYIGQKDKVEVVLTDQVAKELMEPGGACYEGIISMMDQRGIDRAEYLKEDGTLDRPGLAKVLFRNDAIREELNAYVHPAVKREVLRRMENAKERKMQWFFVEAALLIEEHYDALCDELWYIYASYETRKARLKESRGYSDEKIDRIISSQQSEDVFRKYCKVWINNDGDFAKTIEEIDCVMQKNR